MVDYSRDVTNPDYSITTAKDFFGGTDPIRIIIIIYIFMSLILHAIIFVVISLSIKIKKTKLPLAQWIMLLVLLMNLIHTSTYFFQWVIKNGVECAKVTLDKDTLKVGALLIGNPRNISSCKAQGFLLIFSSSSHDFIINIFFYLFNTSKVNQKYVNYGTALLVI